MWSELVSGYFAPVLYFATWTVLVMSLLITVLTVGYSIPAILNPRLGDEGRFYVTSFWIVLVTGLLLMVNSVSLVPLEFDPRWLAIWGLATGILLTGFATYALRVRHLVK